MRKAIAGVDAVADPTRAAFLLERQGHYLRWSGETEQSFTAYESALELLPRGESVQRARLLEHRARGLMLRGRFSEAARAAAEGLAMAERLAAASVHSRALNTLGLSRAALGDIDEGIALLRRSRDMAAEAGPPVEYVQAVTNLSETLDLSGRTEEALAEVRACMEVMRSYPERTSYDTFLEVQGVSHLIRLGRLSELEAGLPAEPFGDSVGTTPIFLHEQRARLALIAGDAGRARSELEELRRLCSGTLDPQWMEPLYGLMGQLAVLEDRPWTRGPPSGRACPSSATATTGCGSRGCAGSG
jgi:tetratricopeptide (TPR) repeat protein